MSQAPKCSSLDLRIAELLNSETVEEELFAVKRYQKHSDMRQRTDDLLHSYRVLWILEDLLPSAQEAFDNFDAEYARTYALLHDLAELITGDTPLIDVIVWSQTGQKDKIRAKDEKEREAIEAIVERFGPTVNGYNLRELLHDAMEKQRLESKTGKFADLLDGYGEAAHEVYCGNVSFVPVVNRYVDIINQFLQNYSGMVPLFVQDNVFFDYPQKVDFGRMNQNKPHTVQSIAQNTGNAFYENWKEITIERSGVDVLLTPAVFLPRYLDK